MICLRSYYRHEVRELYDKANKEENMSGMNKRTARRCEKCHATVGTARRFSYERPKGNINEEEQREYFEGCGVCEVCGRELCNYCGDLRNGVCADCRKEEEEDDDND
jgi:hydroxylamine reductase (hybrid-cluster protein)